MLNLGAVWVPNPTARTNVFFQETVRLLDVGARVPGC